MWISVILLLMIAGLTSQNTEDTGTTVNTDIYRMNTDTDKMNTDTDKMNTDTDKMNTDTDKMNTDTDKMKSDRRTSTKTDTNGLQVNTDTYGMNTDTDGVNTDTDRMNSKTDSMNTERSTTTITDTDEMITDTNGMNTDTDLMNTNTERMNTGTSKTVNTDTDGMFTGTDGIITGTDGIVTDTDRMNTGMGGNGDIGETGGERYDTVTPIMTEVTEMTFNSPSTMSVRNTDRSLTDQHNGGNNLNKTIVRLDNNTECLIEHCNWCYNALLLNGSCEYCTGNTVHSRRCWECLDALEDTDNSTDGVEWQCLHCEPEYTPSDDRKTCISCRESIENCTECSSDGRHVVCGLCDEGYYVDNGTMCEACRNVYDNCENCRFLNVNDTNSLVCTACDRGYFFNYYGNCSACNETIPYCTNCTSLDVCQVFGPVRNLTCHDCEEDYYVWEDQASCKLDCRNVSRLCENCSLEDGVCSSCFDGSYLVSISNKSGTCEDCQKSISNCIDCTTDSPTGEPMCLECDEGFTLSATNTTCIACSEVKHCQKCLSREDGPIQCTKCQVGFSLSNNKCHDCRSITDHCGKCNTRGDCKACVAGFTLTRGKCEKISCGVPPPPPLRGGYAFSGMHYGDTVTYDCECGYDLHGPQTLTCGGTGEWGQTPCCKRKLYGITVTVQYFSHKNLYDDTIIQFLGDNLDPHVRELSLANNHLTHTSWLSEFTQLDSLKSLWMWENSIDSFRWEDFPPLVEEIDFSSNKLWRLPYIGKYDTCLGVQNLYLHRNKLEHIDSRQIPHTLKSLNLFGNQLVVLCDLSHTQLVYLDLSRNQLTDVNSDHLPSSLQLIDFYSNPIDCENLKYSANMTCWD